jgi:hypothetical protein
VDEKAVKALLENDILSRSARLQVLRCDAAGFGQIAVRRFLTVGEWEAFHWRERYSAARTQVLVTVRLRES